MSTLASMKGAYSMPETNPTTAREAALEVWEADLAVMEAEEDEEVGFAYDHEPRARLERAKKFYRDITGKDVPDDLSATWLAGHE